ncbi:opine metallophore biosynthesis dehydrogenase, partial [Staphylococcus pasteuri]|uniref:opine metallophore biosynthesis dehydrogenase n=1 Tax=Staphylococcus pasteuri TaxID=45972 RepID=UPI0036F44EE5
MNQTHITQFQSLPTLKQQYLLYLTYSPILIHPFSQPHQHPPYFHFSPLPFKHLYQNQNPLLHIPTIPTQHYYPTTLIHSIAKPLQLPTPIIHQ